MRLWIGIGCFLAIVVPALWYSEHLDADLLRTDPDMIPADTVLMSQSGREGRQHFAAHCSGCHGVDAKGNTARGIPDLTDADWLYGQGSVSEIERVVYYGIRSANPNAWNLARMPAYATPVPSAANPKIPPLQPGEIRDVVEYLYYQQGRPSEAQAVARGAAIYGNTGGCYDCHSPDAHGDPAIGAPNLVDNITLYGDGSRDALFNSIATGRQGICPAWVGRMSPLAIRETSVYVYSLAHLRASKAVTPAPLIGQLAHE